jgi:ferrous iron transport protein B
MLTGIFAKEAVVGTLNALYGNLGEDGGGGVAEPFDLWAGVGAAFASVPANLADMIGAFADPLGVDIGDTTSVEAAAEAQAVTVGTFGAMVDRFDGKIGAFAYLLAVLLYMPCVAAMAAIYRETGAGWAVFASLWTTGLGFGSAVVVYQIGTYARDPGGATAWIAAVLALFVGALIVLRLLGNREPSLRVPVAAE